MGILKSLNGYSYLQKILLIGLFFMIILILGGKDDSTWGIISLTIVPYMTYVFFKRVEEFGGNTTLWGVIYVLIFMLIINSTGSLGNNVYRSMIPFSYGYLLLGFAFILSKKEWTLFIENKLLLGVNFIYKSIPRIPTVATMLFGVISIPVWLFWIIGSMASANSSISYKEQLFIDYFPLVFFSFFLIVGVSRYKFHHKKNINKKQEDYL